MSAYVRPLSTDIGLMPADICLLSAAVGLLPVDKGPCATDECLMSTDRSLESVAASPLSADKGEGYTVSSSPPRAPRPRRP